MTTERSSDFRFRVRRLLDHHFRAGFSPEALNRTAGGLCREARRMWGDDRDRLREEIHYIAWVAELQAERHRARDELLASRINVGNSLVEIKDSIEADHPTHASHRERRICGECDD